MRTDPIPLRYISRLSGKEHGEHVREKAAGFTFTRYVGDSGRIYDVDEHGSVTLAGSYSSWHSKLRKWGTSRERVMFDDGVPIGHVSQIG